MDGSCGCPDLTVCPDGTMKCPSIKANLTGFGNEACYTGKNIAK